MTELSEQEIAEISRGLLNGQEFRIMPMALKKQIEDVWPRLVATIRQQSEQLAALREDYLRVHTALLLTIRPLGIASELSSKDIADLCYDAYKQVQAALTPKDHATC